MKTEDRVAVLHPQIRSRILPFNSLGINDHFKRLHDKEYMHTGIEKK